MKHSAIHKGFTLIGLLTVIAVIGILSTMIILSSTEAITTAKASNIIANLISLKKATIFWYADHRSQVQTDGRVKIGDKIKPIQEWGDKDLKLSQYIEIIEKGTGINLNKTYKTKNSDGKEQTNTDLAKGYYGICDGGGTVGKRHVWYAGYRFNDNEEKVREKIRGRLKTSNLMFGTADAHPDPDDEKAAAVWLRVW